MVKLKGFFFLQPVDDSYYQGEVIEQISANYMLVQYYSWLDGEVTYLGIIPLETMVGWKLYGSRASWLAAGDGVIDKAKRKAAG